jgi:hypothetical protein
MKEQRSSYRIMDLDQTERPRERLPAQSCDRDRTPAAVENPVERPSIHSPEDCAALVQYEMSALEQEELWTLLLDIRNQVLDIEKVYRGSLTSSQVRVGELFNPNSQFDSRCCVFDKFTYCN